MNNNNYPPGVTGNEPQINGDEAWEKLIEQIQTDCGMEGWSDMDCFTAWELGKSALRCAQKLGAKFPYE